jgi:hypothetical protein
MSLTCEGQGFITVLVAAAISAIVVTASLEQVQFSLMGGRYVASTADLNSTWSLLDLIFKNPATCKQSLKMGEGYPIFSEGSGGAVLTSLDFNESHFLVQNQKIGIYTIDSILLIKEGTGPNYIATLRIRLSKTGNDLGPVSETKDFYLSLSTDGATPVETMTSCSSNGSNPPTNGFVRLREFEIEIDLSTPAVLWIEAFDACTNREARMCSSEEWLTAQRAGLINDLPYATNSVPYQEEWTANISSHPNWRNSFRCDSGGANCSPGHSLHTEVHPFRCCRGL